MLFMINSKYSKPITKKQKLKSNYLFQDSTYPLVIN